MVIKHDWDGNHLHVQCSEIELATMAVGIGELAMNGNIDPDLRNEAIRLLPIFALHGRERIREIFAEEEQKRNKST